MRHGGDSSFVEMRAGGLAPRRQRGGRFYCLDTSTSASTASSTATSTTRSTNTTGPHAAVAALHADIVLSCGVPPASRNLQQGRYRGGGGGGGGGMGSKAGAGASSAARCVYSCILCARSRTPRSPPCLAVRARLRPDNSPASGALLRGLGSTGTRARWHRARGVQEDQRRASRDVARGNHPLVDCSGRGSCPPARISATRQWRGVQAG